MPKLLLIFLFCLPTALLANQADDIIGKYWGGDKKFIIEIYKNNEAYNGKFIWQEKEVLDNKNPDPKLKGRSLIGVDLIENISFNSAENKWLDGRIYSVKKGKFVNISAWLASDNQNLIIKPNVPFVNKTIDFIRINSDSELPEGLKN